jgi:hypothetical protein
MEISEKGKAKMEDLKDMEAVEKVGKSAKPKAEKEKKKLSSAELARLRAEAIRDEIARRGKIQPGEVVGGDLENWVYYHVATGMLSTDHTIARLERLGYERCADGERMIGMNGGLLFKCPKLIANDRAKEKAKKWKRR